MKKILLTTLSLLLALAAFAQRGTVTATIVDADSQETVAGAVLTVTPVKTPDKKQYFTSAYKGAVSIPSLSYGEYTLQIAFLGYNEYTTTFQVGAAKVALGKIELKPGVQIETVVKEVKAIRTSQKGDTVSYNAGAFKVANDADVEGLLKKMPGITIDGGTVSAQGEDVKKVFVDGKEFFGDDVTTAIRSLPAEAVDRVEVYNKLSDAAEFSGMDDGEGFKALNIVTRKNMRQGQFGKFAAVYGYDADTKTEAKNKYLASANVNIFQDDSRLSILGLFNNVNQQNFSFEDIMGVSGSSGGGRRGGAGQYMVAPQSGIASVNALGLNYSGIWGKKDQVTFQGSYFFNNTNTHNSSTVDRWYAAPMEPDTLSTTGYSKTLAYNHRLNARVEWKISENQSLLIRPRFSYQTNDPWSETLGWQYGERGYSRTDNFNDALRSGYMLRLNTVYRLKLGKPGRTITVEASGRYGENANSSNSWSNEMGRLEDRPIYDPDTGEWDSDAYTKRRYLRSLTPSMSYDLRAKASYTEPVSKYSQLSFQYRMEYDYQERDKKSYVTGSDFAIAGLLPNVSLSNAYNSGYLTQSVGPGFRYAKSKNTVVANVYYQRSALDGQVILDGAEQIRHSYDNFTYFVMGQLNINRENSLRLFISSETDNPSVTDLQNVYDVSNAQNISRGNPNLNQDYSHSIRFHYTNSNVEKGRTFMWMFSFQNTSDYNATHTVQNPGTMTIGEKEYKPNYYSMPINLDGSRSVRTNLSYGFPVGFLKSNLNLSAGVSYSLTPSMLGGAVQSDGSILGGDRNDTRNMGYNTRVVLGSNVSENVDFTLSWNSSYNEATNSYVGENTKNRYFFQTAQATMKFVFPLGFTFAANAAYTQNMGFTNDYNTSYMLCSASLGKKLFKNKRGEVSFGVNDIFNQNQAFSRNIGSGYTENRTNSVIGRYYFMQFTFNLRRFGKKGSTNLKDYDGVSSGSSSSQRGTMRHAGPPPGMGGGGRFH